MKPETFFTRLGTPPGHLSILLLLGRPRFFFLLIKKHIYLFMAVLDLRCCTGFSLVLASGIYSLIAMHGLLIEAASLAADHRL